MRWNCPHCGSSLAVADEKISAGWSFSRCYKCGGFALVRKSDVNLIKVDRAPAGEPVLLPEAHENPTTLLSQNATNHLNRYLAPPSPQPPRQLVATQAKSSIGQSAASVLISRAERTESDRKPTVRPATKPAKAAQPKTGTNALSNAGASEKFVASEAGVFLPEPLPEDPSPSFGQRLIPAAIAVTGMFAIASGIYLYIQGQALWEKASTQASHSNAEALPTPPSAPVTGSEIVQAPSLPSITAASANIQSTTPISTAPLAQTTATLPQTSAPLAVTAAPAPRTDVTDEVHSKAMAPNRNMKIELLADSAHIHSGPGMEYPVIGTADNKRKYAVEEWRDRWFKISLENSKEKKSAWIRNDLVRFSQ